MIKQLLLESGIRVIYRPLDCGGRAFPSLKLMVIDPRLSEFEQEQKILHEYAHIFEEHYFSPIESPANHSKKEAKAEHFRIHYNLVNYINNTPKEYWNTLNFINYFNIESKYHSYIEETLKSYKNQRSKND